MALIKTHQHFPGTTTRSNAKPQLCHTCRENKVGVFGVDAYNKPRCYDCMPEKEKAVYAQPEAD